MNEQAGDLAGLTQKEAGERVLAWAEEHGLVEKREHYRHAVGTCERCHSRIEPLVSLQWWCAMEEPAAPAIEALSERRVRFHPESQHRFAITSLEEAPDWCISRQLWWGHQLPIWTCPDGHTTVRSRSRRVRGVRRRSSSSASPTSSTRGSRRRSGRYATLGWPERDARARALLPGERQLDRARDHPALGEPHDLDGARGARRDPVHRRDHPLDRARGRRAADVEEPRHRHRPDGADRGARRGRDALRPPQDLLDAGRALLVRRDRGRAQARDQALERRAADPPERRGCHPGARATRPRGALDPRPARGRARASSRTRGRAFDFAESTRRSTTSRSTTSATGTRRRSSRGSTTATTRRSARRWPRSSACSRSCTR